MVLEFIGADREVTGSCHYLTFGDTHILIDCGMEQGADLYVNQEIPVNPSLIDYVFVTHAHIDHSGLLPLIYNHGFREMCIRDRRMRLIMSLNYLRCTKKQPDWMKLLSFPDVVVEKAFDKNNTKNCMNIWNV